MRIYISVYYLLILLSSCSVEEGKSDKNTIEKSQEKSISRPFHLSDDARLINLGFIDSPSYNWVEYIGNYSEKGKVYPYLYQFKYSNEFGGNADTLTYEWNLGRNSNQLILDNFNDYTFIPFPANGTIKLSKDSQEFILFEVLEFHKFDRPFKDDFYFRIPTVKIHSVHPEHGLVSDDDIEINIKKTQEGFYKIKFIDIKGVKEFLYQKNNDCKEPTSIISYLNKENGNIYYIQNDCYLELINLHKLPK